MTQRETVAQGAFGTVQLDDVLDVVSISRQTLEIVLDEARLVVKSGRVLHADTPDAKGRAAFMSVYARPGRTFAVYRRDNLPIGYRPVGTLTDLIAEAREMVHQSEQSARNTVLEGSFADHRLTDVFDVLALSRQRLVLEVLRTDGTRATIDVKAGAVLACEDPGRGHSDAEAFASILADPGERFVVSRVTEPHPFHPPLGTLSSLCQASEPPVASEVPVVLAGDLSDFPLADLLATLGLSRVTLELVLRDDGGAIGAMLLKAGHVLDAQALRTSKQGVEAVAELLAVRTGRFSVFERTSRQAAQSLGPVAQFLQQALPMVRRKLVLEGHFDRTPVADLLEVLSLSRQSLAVETWRASRPWARWRIKAGRLLEATLPDGTAGMAAFRGWLADPGDRFAVISEPEHLPTTPLCELHTLSSQEIAPSEREAAFLSGTFADFAIETVLEVLSLSRSCLSLQTAGRGRQALMVLKAGYVLSASTHAQEDPARVAAHLLTDPGDRFEVRRCRPPANARNLGQLAAVLDEARKLIDDSVTVTHAAPQVEDAMLMAHVKGSATPVSEAPDRSGGSADNRELLGAMHDLKRRIAHQDRLIAVLAAGHGRERGLILVMLAVQALTVFSLLGVTITQLLKP